ncbi:hypothetical protein BD560DRAFT_430854 [Blakeslea trispora]|nr:hypothetical protein BD560DRAFT_430854 [Blakeslea trispora]
MTSLEHHEPDIIDIQDRLGYLDTGPVLSSLPSNSHTIASNAHLTIKEPKPQRQVWLENKRLLAKRTTPIDSVHTTPSSSKPTVSFTPSTKGKEVAEETSDELKEMMVSKLYELADMLKSMNMDQEFAKPRPKSNPARLIRRKSVQLNTKQGRSKGTDHPQESYGPPQRSYHYPPIPSTSQPYYLYYPYSAEENEDSQAVEELDSLDDLHLEEEDHYYHGYYPYPHHYFDYEEPRLSRAYHYGPRRKSLGNLYEEQHYYPSLQRKSSKNSLWRRQPMIDPRYDYLPPPPPRYRCSPSYYSSPNGYYV